MIFDAGVIESVILFVTAVILIVQINEMQRATYAGVLRNVYDILQADDVREARRIVLNSLADKPVDSWTEKDIKAADKVCSSYDCVGIMVRQGMIPTKFVADSWGNSLRRTWRILSPLVMQYRAQRNAYEFWNDYEWLARQAERFHSAVHAQE